MPARYFASVNVILRCYYCLHKEHASLPASYSISDSGSTGRFALSLELFHGRAGRSPTSKASRLTLNTVVVNLFSLNAKHNLESSPGAMTRHQLISVFIFFVWSFRWNELFSLEFLWSIATRNHFAKLVFGQNWVCSQRLAAPIHFLQHPVCFCCSKNKWPSLLFPSSIKQFSEKKKDEMLGNWIDYEDCCWCGNFPKNYLKGKFPKPNN